MLDKLNFLVGEALSALRRNGLMTFAAITTVSVALFLFGGMGYTYFRLQRYVQSVEGRFEMQVFLRDGATEETVKDVIARIRNIPGVKQATWIPRDKRWAQEQALNPDLTRGIENPFPEAFKVVMSDIGLSDEVAVEIEKFPEVAQNGVVYLKDEVRLVYKAMETMRIVGGTVGGLLFLTAGLLIYNTIRLTVLARRLEIRVMQLVGASRLTIQVPFLVEGIAHGVIGGVLATTLIWIAQYAFNEHIGKTFRATTAAVQTATPLPFPAFALLAILCGAGAFYGLLCSSFAVNTPLKYR